MLGDVPNAPYSKAFLSVIAFSSSLGSRLLLVHL